MATQLQPLSFLKPEMISLSKTENTALPDKVLAHTSKKISSAPFIIRAIGLITDPLRSSLQRALAFDDLLQKLPLEIRDDICCKLQQLTQNRPEDTLGQPIDAAQFCQALLDAMPIHIPRLRLHADTGIDDPPLFDIALPAPPATRISSERIILKALKIAVNTLMTQERNSQRIYQLLGKYAPGQRAYIILHIHKHSPKALGGISWAQEHLADDPVLLGEALLKHLPVTLPIKKNESKGQNLFIETHSFEDVTYSRYFESARTLSARLCRHMFSQKNLLTIGAVALTGLGIIARSYEPSLFFVQA